MKNFAIISIFIKKVLKFQHFSIIINKISSKGEFGILHETAVLILAKKYTDVELRERFESREQSLASSSFGVKHHELLFKPYHVTATEYRVLSILLFSDAGCEPSVIADKMNILRQTMTKVVDSLVYKGLVTRSAHPTDRRKVYVMLLPAGVTLARELLALEADFNAAVTAYFKPGELELFQKLSQKLHTARETELQRILDDRASGFHKG